MLVVTPADARLDYVVEGWRPWVILILLSLSLFLPGIASLPPVDRDEARFVQATRQMVESGDFVRIRFQEEARNKKPAGVYWLQSAFVAVLSRPDAIAVWPYRLVSVLGATIAVLLTFYFGAALLDRRTALIGAALLAACLDLVFEAHVATTDALLLPEAVAAQGILGLAYLSERRGEGLSPRIAVWFWVAQGVALLVKGPVLPGLSAITALTLVLWERRSRWLTALRPVWFAPITLAMIVPWLVLIELATNGTFLHDSVGQDFAGKLIGGQEAHGAFPGYYLLLLPVTFWPGTLFLGLGAVWLWRMRRLPVARLLAAWIVPFWILLELVPTKLPHYVLPLYPALALACARALVAVGEDGMAPPVRPVRLGINSLWVAIGIAIAGALLLVPPFMGRSAPVGGAIAVAAALALGWQAIRTRLTIQTAGIAVLASLLITAPGFGMVLPGLDPLWLSRRVERLVAAERKPGERVSSSGYSEPSLVFLLGTDTALIPVPDAAESLATGRTALALIEQSDDQAFRTSVEALGRQLVARGEANGFDYSNGKYLRLRLYRIASG